MSTSDEIVQSLNRVAVELSEETGLPLTKEFHDQLARIKAYLDEPVEMPKTGHYFSDTATRIECDGVPIRDKYQK